MARREAIDPELAASGLTVHDTPVPELRTMWGIRYHVITADGKFRLLKHDMPEETMRALITRNDGKSVKLD